ncbi:MAG TPA: hypothetical protein VFP23_08320 [Solirubrobacterales bacterium]|nr:hypothetical protein [Solirubrobacterales bacterium]
MAEGERRLLFDVRGRRRHVVRVVYAILALLMMSSLFFVVGPFNFSSLFGQGGTSSAAKVLNEQAERVERRLAASPADKALLLAATRARIGAGNAQVEVDPATGAPTVTPEARADLERATGFWDRYVKEAGAAPSPSVALLVASAHFGLAQAGTSTSDIDAHIKQAAAAQRIVAKAHPSVGSLSTLAIYEYFSGDFAGGDRAARQAEAKAPSKAGAAPIEKQLAEYRKRAKQYAKQRAQLAKLEKSKGKEALQNPLGGLAGGSSGLP